ncbi:MAG: AMP-binding protein [Verrucomicrobiales bacterium]|nr:AMP-binding protein [Verrucomicrobiota bacterium JB025]
MSSAATQILNQDRIPNTGVLVIPGRLNFEEALQLEKIFAGRQITWLIEEESHHDAQLRSYLEKSGAGAMFSAADAKPESAGEQLGEFLNNNGTLIYVPGRAATRAATPCHIPGSHLKAMGSFGLPILPVCIDRPRESALAIERRASLPQTVIAFGKPIGATRASAAAWQQSFYEAGEEALSSRPLLNGSLGMALLEGLCKHGSKNLIFDGSDDSELPYAKVLPVAIALSKVIKRETDQPRVAIVLPPGKAGLIANIAVIFAGKIPVNLNFTAGPEAVRSCIRQSGVDRFITADPFVRKVSSFPWPPNRDLILVERVIPNIKKDIIKWAAITKIMPASALGFMLGLNKRKGDDEALVIFTSGSAGEPKGVPLTHRNVLANVNQFAARVNLAENASILGCLPLFHSFGCTVTLWFPIIEGINLVTYPSPLETKRLAELIALHQVDLLLSTPTFLRGYMKRIDPPQLSSLKLVVTGAEKLPRNLANAFEEKFGIAPQEGYGLTETSPATNVNLPDPEPEKDAVTIPSSRPGSVGHLLPGLAIRITDPVTDKEQPLSQQGIIWFKGANVFTGYLKNPEKSKDVLDNGWFRTGDVGRVDDDGFLYIEGRISRFSKIGGEMVPHEAIEAAINKVLGLDNEAERRIAIVGVPDEQKGEAILLLSTIAGQALEQECIDLRYKLLDEGLSSLWCPKTIIPVSEIPVLASGKLDIKGCEALVGSDK